MLLVSESKYREQDHDVCLDPMTAYFEADNGKIYRVTLDGKRGLHAIMNDDGPAIDRAAQANAMLDRMLALPRPVITYTVEKEGNEHQIILNRRDEDDPDAAGGVVATADSHDAAAREAKRLQTIVNADHKDWHAAQEYAEARVRPRGDTWEIVLVPEDGVGLFVGHDTTISQEAAYRRMGRINQMIGKRQTQAQNLLAIQANYEGWAAW